MALARHVVRARTERAVRVVVPVLAVLDRAIPQGRRSFQSLFRSLQVDALPLTEEVEMALRDWDTPGDIPM